jgi:hypothetical protein
LVTTPTRAEVLKKMNKNQTQIMTHYHCRKGFFYVLIVIFLLSCGAGNTGKIKSYEYNITKAQLESYISKYFNEHSELKKADTLKQYDLKGTGYEDYVFNCYLESKNNSYVFTLSYIGDSTYWSTHKNSELAIVSAGKFGDSLKFNSELGFIEKRELIKIFEENFINKLPVKPITSD